MGQGQSRNDMYYNAIHKKNSLDISKLSPYVVLDLHENFTYDELVKAYRQTAIKVHPDKGGSEELFNIVTECFKSLANEYKLRQVDKPHHVLKQDFSEYVQPQSIVNTFTKTPDFNNTFNKLFEENKLEDDDNARGYAHLMVDSTKEREDFKIKRLMKKFDKNKFNKTFDSVVKPSTDVIIYKEPEPLLLSKSLDFTVLGDKIEDFTTDASKDTSLRYSDYYKAHTTSRLVDHRSVQKRKEYRTVGDYENDRAIAVEKPMDDAELKYRKAKEIHAQKKEEERIRRMNMRDEATRNHYEKVNKLMLKMSL